MFHLRYYQHDARDGIRAAFDQYRSTLCVMPTGTGKTETFLSIAVEEVGRVLVIVHRDYLITSPVARLAAVGFTDVGIEKAEQRSEGSFLKPKIVFASVQSIGPVARMQRLQTFNPKEFSLVIVDEAHLAMGPIYRRVLEYFQAGNPHLKVLLVTATPKRKDGQALGTICDSVAFEMSPGQAAQEGWIVPPRFFVRDVPELDYSRVNLRGSELDADQVAALLMEEEPLHRVCASLAEDQGPTIVFCPRVDVAQAYAEIMDKRYRRGKAIAIHQDSTDEEMTMATEGLKDGTKDYVFNVNKLTEGYDVPRVVRVAWASPTASLVRWTQGCGRGFRPDASIAKQLIGNKEDAPGRRLLIEQSSKPFCSIVTYYPSNCLHQICTAVDLLGGNGMPAEVKGYAEQVQEATSRQEGGSGTEEDIETAKIFVDLKTAAAERLRELKAKAKVADQEYDGMGGNARKLKDSVNADPSKTPDSIAASWGVGEAASEKQMKWFKWKKIDIGGHVLTKWRACVVRDLIEAGVRAETALSYGKRQALSVRDSYRAKTASTTDGEGIPL